MTQLQADLHAFEQQHQSQITQMGKDKESLLASLQTLEDQSAQLRGKLDMQRCASMHVAKSRERLKQQTIPTGPVVGGGEGGVNWTRGGRGVRGSGRVVGEGKGEGVEWIRGGRGGGGG